MINIDKIKNSTYIKPEDKEYILNLFDVSNKITFGKKGRSEGYIYKDVLQPRCTSVLRMDGTKADGLMLWAKREVAQYAKDRLTQHLLENGSLNALDISAICQEALDNPDKQRDTAADKGSDTHDNVEKWLNGLPCVEDDNLRTFKNIWNSENVELIATELPLVYVDDNGNGFGGKLDILAYDKNTKEFVIYDNKTSKSLHQSYGIQVGAYKCAIEFMSNRKITVSKAKIIHLPDLSTLSETQKKDFQKRGNLVECKNLTEAIGHFFILLHLYKRRNNKYL